MRRFVTLMAMVLAGLAAPSAASAQRFVADALFQGPAELAQGRGRPDDKAPRPDERPRSEREPPRPPPPQRRISERQAIAAVERVAGPGHHLDVFAREVGGRPTYTVRWAGDNGQRRDYYVDAETGSVR